MNRAIDLIRDEMVENHGNDAITAIGDLLLENLLKYPQNESQIISAYASNKNLKTAFKAIEDYARRHQQNRCAVVAPDKAMEIVLIHFGINGTGMPAETNMPANNNDFDVRLEDLL